MHASAKKALLAAACSLMFGTVIAADLDPAGDIKAQAEKFVKVDNPEYLAGIKRVVITSYAVDFVSELKYSKSLSGLEAMIGADSDVTIKLVGSNNEQYQAITDKFYQQTVEQLKAQGIEVVSNEELKALPEFAELAASGVTPVPSEQDATAGKGLFFTTQGLPLQLSDETQFIPTFRAPFTKPKKDDFLTFGTRFSGGFSAGQAQMIEETWDFTVNSKASADGAWTVEIEPINDVAQGTLAYDNWVKNRKEMVDRLSNNEIGYLHIRAMDAPSLRKFELDLADNRFKKALIIDQRFNGGGGIDQELLRILGQKKYQMTRRRDSVEQDRPQQAFFGPMVVMQNERSASDAEMFPDGFRALGLGKVIGVPTYGGVIGTGSFTLMNGAAIRTPGAGVYNAKGINMENYGVPPDVYVDNPPEEAVKGRDLQIEKAIEVLRAELKNAK